jgi:hypothetical protein
MPASRARFPVRFVAENWSEDMARASAAGRAAAQAARDRYGRNGVPFEELCPCQEEARDGTRLFDCVKLYLPAPSGRFGMVFRADKGPQGPTLVYLAFGVRHHPRDSNAPTVYQIADLRLNR